jgi:hypothetical protein
MASEIVGKDKIIKYIEKFDFQKIKLSKGTETIYIRRIKDGENQTDLINDFIDWIDEFVESNNFKEYKIELFGSYSNDPGAKLSPIVKASISFHHKPGMVDGMAISRPSPTAAGPIDVDKYVAMATENARLQSQLERMEEKMDEILADDDDDGDDVGEPQTLGAAMNATIMQKLPAIVDLIIIKLMGGNMDPAMMPANPINGIDDNDSRLAILDEFQTIHPEINDDLIRLMKLAKTQPDFFKMLIVQLRNMVK